MPPLEDSPDDDDDDDPVFSTKVVVMIVPSEDTDVEDPLLLTDPEVA